MTHRLNLLSLVFLFSLLSACGGGGSDSSSDDPGSSGATERLENENIPTEFAGEVESNLRHYAATGNGFKLELITSGIDGELVVEVEGDKWAIDSNGSTFVNLSKLAGESVQVVIDQHPFLQECQFSGAVNTGTVEADSPTQLTISCSASSVPAAPHIKTAYSAEVDSINLTWEDANDNDTAADNLSYRIYYSSNADEVAAKASAFVDVAAGTTEGQVTSLSSDTNYALAIATIDSDSNTSELSPVIHVRTIAEPNVLTGTPVHVIEPDDATISDTSWQVTETAFSSTPQVGDVLISVTDTDYHLVKISSLSLDAETYDIAVGSADITDVFDTLTISNNMGFELVEEGSGTFRSVRSKGYRSQSFSLSLCRAEDEESTIEESELAGITLTPITNFSPRVNNQLKLSFGSLTGSIGFEGEVEVGVDLDMDFTKTLSGTFKCPLTGFPLESPSLRYTIGFVPIVQDFSLDIELVLNFNLEAGIQAGAKAVAVTTLEAKLTHNSETDEWDPSSSVTPGFKTTTSYKNGATVSITPSIIPTVATTLNKTLTAGIQADANAKGEVSVVATSEDDPIFKLYNYPYILDEFLVDAGVNLSLEADINFLGLLAYEFPSWQFYASPRETLFDTPKLCTNSSPSKDNCESFKRFASNGKDAEYDLEIFSVDGTLFSLADESSSNKLDLASLEWQVSPSNGHIEVNPDDRRKATFKPGDDGNYTIVVSGHGMLGKPARKFAQFSIASGCNYGLGRDIPGELDQYKSTAAGSTGYIFPEGALVPSDKDYIETCSHGNEYFNSDGHFVIYTEINSYYAGQLDGQTQLTTNFYDNKDGNLLYTLNTSKSFKKGFITSQTRTYEGQWASYVVGEPKTFTERYSKFNLSNSIYLLPVYRKLEFDHPYIETREIVYDEVESLQITNINRDPYSDSGYITDIVEKRSISFPENLDDYSNNALANHEPIAQWGIDYSNLPIYLVRYYSNGEVSRLTDNINSIDKACGYPFSVPPEQAEPGTRYACVE